MISEQHVDVYIRKGILYFSLPCSLLILLIVIIVDLRAFLGPAIGTTIGSILAIVLDTSKNNHFPIEPGPNTQIDWRIPMIGTLLYVFIVFSSYRFVLHDRPVIHYISFGLIISFIGYQIYLQQPRTQVLTQIIVVAFTTYWSIQLAFPAGVRNQDTRELIDGFQAVAAAGVVTDATRYAHTPIQPIFNVQIFEITAHDPMTIYNLSAVIILSFVILYVGLLDYFLPRISQQTALFSAIFFSISPFWLNNGFMPNKMNFFMPLLFIVILAILGRIFTRTNQNRWTVLGIISFSSLTLGHEYSAGATSIIISGLITYAIVNKGLNNFRLVEKNRSHPYTAPMIFLLMFFGYSVVTGSITLNAVGGIFTGIVDVIFGATEGGGLGAGRYDTLDFDILLFATTSEMIIFILSISGLLILLQQNKWSLDIVGWWVIFAFGIIVVGLVIGTAHLSPRRVFGLLTLFGLNITMAIGLQLLSSIDLQFTVPNRSLIAIILCIFAILSLLSPISAIFLSPISDEVAHDRHYKTQPHTQGIDWMESYAGTDGVVSTHLTRYTEEPHLQTMIVPHSEVDLTVTENNTVKIDRESIDRGNIYMYNSLGEKTGIQVTSDRDQRSLGGRNFGILVPNNDSNLDNMIYTNRELIFYERR